MNAELGLFWLAVIAGFVIFALDYLTVQRPARRRAAAGTLADDETAPQGTPWYVKYFVLVLILFFVILVLMNVVQYREQQFVYLADAFLHGQAHFLERPGLTWGDTVEFEGRHYWPLGPFPAVLLMPAVLVANVLNVTLYQSFAQIPLIAGIFALMVGIARRLNYTWHDGLFWGFVLPFGSALMGLAFWPWSWQFSQVVTTFLLCWAIFEYVGRRRYWLIGVLLACVAATRISAAFIVLFFAADILTGDRKPRDKARSLAALLVPIAVAGLLLAAYNYARFGSFTEQGYSLQTIPEFLARTRDHGLFSLAHLPGNLYFFFISAPDPVFLGDGSQVLRPPFIRADPLGMSVFVTSPIVLYFSTTRVFDRFTRLLLLGILAVALPVFLYYGIGWRQVGYRYSLDFLPFVFWLLMRNYRLSHPGLSSGFKLLVVVSAFFNLYLFWTLFWPA